ncbi:MAG TPA: peptidylprolyl isomerase [Gemmatimonadales bacterium]|nr:peptidylprolyl isomerase [Gemmatimonadales bacterium]
MRRALVMLGLVATIGCGEIRNMFSSHADVAAEAGDRQLTAQQVGELMARTKGVQLTPQAAEFISNVWVDYTLFAQAVAAGTLPSDSADIARVMWSDIAELKATQWYDTLVARRASVGPELADSVYAADSVRIFQHMLFRVAQGAPSNERAAARQKAVQALARVRRGADFGQLASGLSDDPGSRRDNGYLPPTARGGFVTAFDSAGWQLSPGALSDVVETPFGYHVIYRPPVEMVRERLLTWQKEQVQGQLDSLYLDELGKVHELKVKSGAPAVMRQAIKDPLGMKGSKKQLTTFEGGGLTVADFLRWVQTPELSPAMGQIAAAEDEQLRLFAERLSTNILLLRQADSAGITLSPVEWQSITAYYRASVDTLRQALGLNSDVTDSSLSADQRAEVAALKVDDFFTRITQGQAILRRLPSSLSTVLRERAGDRIYPNGLTRAVELANEARTPPGSKTPTTVPGPAPTPTLEPAAGPPPVPGATGAPPATEPSAKP